MAQVGQRWGHCARDAGRGVKSPIHVVGDGAEWIRLQSREIFGDKANFLCDFYHVSEYLGEAAGSCRPKDPKRWLKTQQSRLKRNDLKRVMQELVLHLEPEKVPEEEAPVRRCRRYLSNRSEALDYAGAKEKGLPIGSGLIESGHKHVLQARLKQAGTAWLAENAERIAQLRVLRVNGVWETLWN